MQLTLPSKTQGQRPPPFDGPPCAVSCGGEDFGGDAAHYLRSLEKYMDTLSRVAAADAWSIQMLGVQDALSARYWMLMRACEKGMMGDPSAFAFGFDDACHRLDELEDLFFANFEVHHLAPPIEFDAGWIGPHDPTTLLTLAEVRQGLLDICFDIRDRRYFEPALNREIVGKLIDRLEQQLDSLFRITGPDETTWLATIGELADAARVLKNRAKKLISRHVDFSCQPTQTSQ